MKRDCTCGAVDDGKWAGIHSKDCAVFKPLTEAEIRADERAKCAAEIREMNAEKSGHEWVVNSLWHNIIERAALHILRVTPAVRDGGRMDMEVDDA